MSQICVCGGRLGATGIGNCVIKFSTTHNYILMPIYNGSGAKNFIDLSDATLGATLVELTTTATPMLERLYPLPFAENIDRTKSETTFETPPSGNKYKVQEGLRQNIMEFMDDNATFAFARELDEFGCTKMGYFAVDINGTIEGHVDDSNPNRFYPLPMMKGSFDKMVMYATDTTVQKLKLQFDLQRSFDETRNYYITSNDLGYPATELVGLIPASIVVSNITSTGATFTITENGNSPLNKRPVEGILLAAFDLLNVTTGLSVSVTGANEISPGVYECTWVAITGANIFEITANATGYDVASKQFNDPA